MCQQFKFNIINVGLVDWTDSLTFYESYAFETHCLSKVELGCSHQQQAKGGCFAFAIRIASGSHSKAREISAARARAKCLDVKSPNSPPKTGRCWRPVKFDSHITHTTHERYHFQQKFQSQSLKVGDGRNSSAWGLIIICPVGSESLWQQIFIELILALGIIWDPFGNPWVRSVRDRDDFPISFGSNGCHLTDVTPRYLVG